MKILIDCSNLRVGGGIQVALSFINDLIKMDGEEDYIILMSPQLALSLKIRSDKANLQFIELHRRYYTNIFVRRHKIKQIEKEIKPDVIFTVFGPSYHKSKFPKIVGFAIGHLLYTDSPYFKKLDFISCLKLKIMLRFKKWFFINKSDAIIFETKDAKDVFLDKINNSIDCYVVDNTLNEIFTCKKKWANTNFKINGTFNILCLTANYPHKNLSIIPIVIDRLIESGKIKNFKFIISLNKEELEFSDKYDNYIHYLGKIDIEEVPALYEQVDILFMPTLLEIFSTSYLEAMYMKKPIVSSDMSFARDVCRDAALYCSPLNSSEYAGAIINLYNNNTLRVELIDKGLVNLKRFGNSMDRTNSYLEIIKKYSLNENK